MGKNDKMLPQILLLLLSCLTPVKCNRKWLTYQADSQKINTLAFIGTHDTASYGTSFIYAQTQSIGITLQLEAGIRVFDMRVRRTNNAFAMHHDFIYLGTMFGDLVTEVYAYLQTHPKEFVIMLMQEEYTAESSTMSECEILVNQYLKDWPNLFVQHWSIGDTIGKHRGKILLARAHRGFQRCVTQLPCKEQNQYELNSKYHRAEKSNDIKALQAEVSARTHQHKCYINYLSANGGVLHTPNTIANDPRELLRSNGNPIFAAHIFITSLIQNVNIAKPGMNNIMVSEFHNPRNTLYIIMADFPSQILIDKVVNSNNRDIVGPSWS